MSIVEEAARFKGWAAEHGILTYQPPDDDLGHHDDQLDALVSTNQVLAVESILNQRKINLVLVSPENNEIIVCTHQKLTKKELETLPTESEGGATFRYLKRIRRRSEYLRTPVQLMEPSHYMVTGIPAALLSL